MAGQSMIRENMDKKPFKTKYGYFSNDGKEYIITTPLTPQPWVNVICPGEYGFIVSQCGTGYSWHKHATINRLTRWEQDLTIDECGKFLYMKDLDNGIVWSPTWKPVRASCEYYECRHGIGYTVFLMQCNGIESEVTMFVPPDKTLEIWSVKLKNLTYKDKSILIQSYIEWSLGMPYIHKEFDKLFIQTEYRAKTIFATRKDWPYCAFHSLTCSPPEGFILDKNNFFGREGSPKSPKSLELKKLDVRIDPSRLVTPIACNRTKAELKPGQEIGFGFITGISDKKKNALALNGKYKTVKDIEESLSRTKKFWVDRLSDFIVETPNDKFNFLTNWWLKYQAISGRIKGRTGYYQPGGAFGFRDQLQDSQVYLPLQPEKTKKQILLHAGHQYKSGIVKHWWHPITEDGPESKFSDDLLWLPFVTLNYIKETEDYLILDEKIPYLDFKQTSDISTLYEHCVRAIDKALSRFSKRGLPLIGEGDWNDGLSNAGKNWKGESIWLAHFLYGILNDWTELLSRMKIDKKRMKTYSEKAQKLKSAVNKYAWDGNWYIRATKDSGEAIGSNKCTEGKIYLNAQVWAVINRLVPKDRIERMLNSVEKYLYKNYGPIVFYPAYSKYDSKIGYITKYPAGVRENGGVYTHAATWAVWMECLLKRSKRAWKLYNKISPIVRAMEPDLYLCEPYVTAGNTDGPDSPHYGKGGWTWYTGSAAWLFKISAEGILGIKSGYDGLYIDPCLPPGWKRCGIYRVFRGTKYKIEISRPDGQSKKIKKITVDGKVLKTKFLPQFKDGKVHNVKVSM
ncbi:MAG: glycosyl transferase family 36 [Elusimicrobia bacterium]|nr:glycosyl transferase family 36 [Elusimicrobiota bacterium]